MTAPVRLDRLGHVAIVTLNRPDAANAVNPEVVRALEQAARNVETDPAVRVAILAGAGSRAFCAGADLKSIAAGEREALYSEAGGFAGFVDLPRAKPWIAAVDAPALAGGLELALSCDLIVAGATARFGLPEVTRGLVAAAGGLFRLPRRIGRGQALHMIATGDPLSAQEALRIGLVDALASEGTALDLALSLAQRIALNAPIAVRESLAVARAASDLDVDGLRTLSREAALRNAATEDFREGRRAFLEKRQPNWSGR